MKGLAPHTRQVFEAVSRLDCIKPYLLVGGTALSLHPFCCSLLLALLLLGFCACGHGSYPSVLLRADSLASVAPDSARVLLARWADSAGHAPERVRMYHRLLTIKAADKAYVRHTSDSLIKKVVAYYEDGGDKSLLPEAYYYAGRVYRDLGDAPQALDYFERAADVLPPRGQEVLAGKIYSQTGTLFLYQQMYEEALEMFRRAYAYDVKAGDVRGQVFALRDITNVYQRMEKLDSTLAYIQKAHVLASECGNVDMLSLVQGQRLSLYLQLQKYDSAEVCLREAFKHVHKANHSGLYSMASQLYNYTGRLDSAIYYWNLLVDSGTIYAKGMSHFALAQVAMRRKDTDKALRHFVQYQLCEDSIRRLTNTETIRQMHSLYNYKLREKENQKLKAEKRQHRRFLYGMGLSLLLIVLICIILLQRNRQRKMRMDMMREKMARQQEESRLQREQLVKANREKIEDLERKLAGSVAGNESLHGWLLLQKKQAARTNARVEDELKERDRAEEMLLRSDIYHKFHQAASRNGRTKVDEADWDVLRLAVDACYHDFTSRLCQIYPLSRMELRISLLLKIGIGNNGIARVVGRGNSAIVSARKSLYAKFHGTAGRPQDWDAFIMRM